MRKVVLKPANTQGDKAAPLPTSVKVTGAGYVKQFTEEELKSIERERQKMRDRLYKGG